ncbi:hypothetical protein TRFO_19156 [Tritrichomonas foetus]|uniref:Uncharacterized protein n=1 Tax=Tritrichomonas foetus TaxID=1144522 RepID=A0A1J4KNZ1_9EUKA|nr:hypothetical protein TRFO_19156 [Tritrichomonas foetus]|eukprot:OHT11422.1 hypothetical protein TRFO_19156 [Tritrichomonas foetus]
MDQPETPKFMRTFTLWANNQRYDFDGEKFAKMSRKCARLLTQGQTQGTINRRVRADSLTAFASACQLQQFKVTPTNAYEIRELAVEWEVPTLIQFIDDFIHKKKLPPPEEGDILEQLLKHVKQGIFLESDINAVANIINDALVDERFIDVPPEIIFQIVISAEQRGIDKQRFLEFVLTLFYKNAESAVPLILLIDFDHLTDDQTEGIFLCREVHEQNISFFIAWALSSSRNKAENELLLSDRRHHDEIETLRELLKKAQLAASTKMKKEHDQEAADLLEIVKKQQQTLDQLVQATDAQREEYRRLEDEHQQKLASLENTLRDLLDEAKDCAELLEKQQTQVERECQEQIPKLRAELMEQIDGVRDRNIENLDNIEKSITDVTDKEKEQAETLERDVTLMEEQLATAKVNMKDIKAAIAVKIVRDRLRFDKFLRDKDEQLKVFRTKGGVWGIKPKEAEAADKQISELQKRIDELCPIRGSRKGEPSE